MPPVFFSLELVSSIFSAAGGWITMFILSWSIWRAPHFGEGPRGFIESRILQEQINKGQERHWTQRSDLQGGELPGYSADPVRLSPVNSSPPAVTKTCVLLFISFVNFRSRSQTNHKTNVSLRGFNIELSRKINFPNNSRSRLSPADTQMLEMINVPRPGGWFTRVLWLQFKWDHTGK